MNKLFSLLSLLFLANVSFAETLSLEDFLSRLQENHPFIQAELISSKIKAAEQESELGGQDWTLNAGASLSKRKSPELGVFIPESRTNFDFNLDAQKDIWSSGGSFNLGYYDDYEKAKARERGDGFSSSDFTPEKYFQKGVFASYNQPLLKNRGGALSRLSYELKGKSTEMAAIQTLENVENFLLNSGLLFIEWSQLEEKKKILKKRAELSKKQLAQTKRMTKAGVKENEDLYRVEGSYWSIKQGKALMEANAEALKQEIKALLELEDDKLFSGLKLKSLDIDNLKENKLSGVEDLRALKIIELSQERKRQEVAGVKEEGKDNLDLELLAGLAEGDDEYSDDFSLSKPEARVSLNYSRVIGKRSNKALISASEKQIDQLSKQLNSEKIILKSKIRSLEKQIKLLETVYQANKKQLKSARLRTESEEKAYKQGRGELNFVIESQDSVQAASFQIIETVALYHSLKLKLNELSDKLLKDIDA